MTVKSVVKAAQPEVETAITHQQTIGISVERQKENYLISRGAVKFALVENQHYGPPWPGSTQHSLLLAGAEAVNKLMNCYAAAPVLEKDIWDFDRGFFYFSYRVDLIDNETGKVVASAVASCNSYEDRFRFRNKNRSCPACGSEAIFKSKYPDKVTGDIGFYCNKKAGGCGASFKSIDPAITEQEVGKKVNENPLAEIANIQAIAIKRAHVKASRLHACLSGTFSQDAEDFRQGFVQTKSVTPTRSEVADHSAPFTEDYLKLLKEEVIALCSELVTASLFNDKDQAFGALVKNDKATLAALDKVTVKSTDKIRALEDAVNAANEQLACLNKGPEPDYLDQLSDEERAFYGE